MSHFAVLVIGDDVEGQLAPYHEFECTGQDDQYVQNLDRTEEARQEFESRDRDGESFAQFVEEWYGISHPIGPHEEPDLSGPHKYGWVRVNDAGEVLEVINRTNPNKRWDWWVVGGRWTGFFRLREEAEGVLGRPGTFEQIAPAHERLALATKRREERRADQARKGDVDFDAIRDEAAERAAETYDRVHAVIAGRAIRPWEEVREAYPGDLEAARKAYREQPAIRDLNADGDLMWEIFEGVERFLVSREAFLQRARIAAVQTFAVVKDGQWYERGRMGWFACVHDEKDPHAWDREFAALIDGLPDDTLLTVVDCHI